jgi:DNA repair exonuclease SbcCD ATPase subunit
MAGERMTVAVLAKELRSLSERVEKGFAQVDERFAQVDERLAQVDERFAQMHQRFTETDSRSRTLLEQFEERIVTAFKINLERMEAKLDAALDDTRDQKRRLDVFERANAEEHRLMQAQIDDVDARLPRRRTPRRHPS